MKTKDLTKYFISCGAIIYTVLSAVIITISLLLSSVPEYSAIAPKPFLLLLAYAYIISLGNTLTRVERISPIAKKIIHFSCYTVGFFAFIMLCGIKLAVSAVTTVIFAVIYAAVALISSALRNKKVQKAPAKKSVTAPKAEKKKPEKHTDNTYKNRFS